MSLISRTIAANAQRKERDTYAQLLKLTENRLPTSQDPCMTFEADGQMELWLQFHGRDEYSLGHLKDITWEGDQRQFETFMVFKVDQWGGIKAERLADRCSERDSAGGTVRELEGKLLRAENGDKDSKILQDCLRSWLHEVNRIGYRETEEQMQTFEPNRGYER